MKRYLLIGLAALGFSANATAQDDVTAVLGNLDTTINALSGDLQDGLLESSDPATLFELTDTALNTLPLVTDPVKALLFPDDVVPSPFSLLFDLPRTAEFVLGPLEALPGDLNTIASNLENVPDAAIEGRSFSYAEGTQIAQKTGLRDAGIELLKGNLVEPRTSGPPQGPMRPSAIDSALLSLPAATEALFADTTYDPPATSENALAPNILDLSGHVLIVPVAVNAVAAPLDTAEEPLAPLFEGAEPLTLPLIEAIEGADL